LTFNIFELSLPLQCSDSLAILSKCSFHSIRLAEDQSQNASPDLTIANMVSYSNNHTCSIHLPRTCRISNIEYRISNIDCWLLNIEYRILDIRYRIMQTWVALFDVSLKPIMFWQNPETLKQRSSLGKSVPHWVTCDSISWIIPTRN
jgi:hypothetical protein